MGKALAEMGNPQLLLVLLSTRSQPYYALIKRVCDQYLGVHTVCLVEDKLFDKYDNFEGITDQQAGNLALKFQSKAWWPEPPDLQAGEQTICLRLPGHRERHHRLRSGRHSSIRRYAKRSGLLRPSLPATDKEFAHFSASMRLQASTQETIEEMEDMVYRRLAALWQNARSFACAHHILS